MKKLRIGISSCLLGDEVRFDGGHKRDASLLDAFEPYVEWVRVCPEVEAGMGVPREPVQLVRDGAGVRMVAVHTRVDHTDRMRAFAARRLEALAGIGLRGYVLKADSPSCGPGGVKLFDAGGAYERTAAGLFAAALKDRFPGLPIEDEARLADPRLRDAFLQHVLAYDRDCAQVRPPGLTPVREIEVTRVSGRDASRATDLAAAEEPLDVRLHGRSFAIIMRTPGDDRALAAGFLQSERVLRSADDIGAIEHCRHPDRTEAHHVVDVFLRGAAAARVPALLDRRRASIANSSCGVCGRATIDELRTGIDPLPIGPPVEVELVHALPDRLRERQSTFARTGGLHGAAAFGGDAELLAVAEDVGRHNAVDKVIGSFLLEESRGTPEVLMVSGRVSFEIVQKAWLARIPIVAAISAPTSLAVELAQEAGITLLGFVRERSLNIYTHPSRIAVR
jgi:FdhD protein